MPKPVAVTYRRHTVTYSPMHDLWCVRGPIVAESYGRTLHEATDVIDFWLKTAGDERVFEAKVDCIDPIVARA